MVIWYRPAQLKTLDGLIIYLYSSHTKMIHVKEIRPARRDSKIEVEWIVILRYNLVIFDHNELNACQEGNSECP